MRALSTRHLLSIRDLTVDDCALIFQTAAEFKDVLNRPIKKVPSLRDLTIVNLFFENSTRTRLSFELAEKRLSADVVNFSAAASSVSKGETLVDTVNNILAMKVDMVVMRHPLPGAAAYLRSRVNTQIINAGDGTHEHPTQALLDAFSLLQRFGTLRGLRVAIVGDIRHSRVAISNILLLNLLGAKVVVCGPRTFLPKYIEALGVEISHDLDATLDACDVVNMLRIQLERQDSPEGIPYFSSLREYAAHFGLNENRLARLKKDLVIMHPGPINRGVELTGALADGEHSLILEQVENGVAVRMAVLYLLAGRK